MSPRSWAVLRYPAAVLAVVLAGAVQTALEPVWSGRVLFVPFYPAVVFVAWFGGRGPGLLATILSALAITRAWVVAPAVPLVGHLIALVFFVGVGLVVSVLVAARDRARAAVDLLLRHTPLGLAIPAAAFRYMRVNQALAQINGVPVHAHRGRPVRQVLGDTAADVLEPLLRQVHETRVPVTVESMRVPLASGEDGERYFSVVYSPILDRG